MTVRAVVFDFSGTLFRLEQEQAWFEGLHDEYGQPFDAEGREALLRRMVAPVREDVDVPEDVLDAWERRDLDPGSHRKAYVELLVRAGLTREQAATFYGRLSDPLAWTPYPDAAEVLHRLHAQGTKTAVLSNIGYDIRPAFANLGVLDQLDEVFMSYVEGRVKPDAELFRRVCTRLGVAPSETVMVGDSVEADGGATEIGCRVVIVDPLPVAERKEALITALETAGVL